jgi:predicted AlkP superfamily pyrophosphatase or phosphodiesterase
VEGGNVRAKIFAAVLSACLFTAGLATAAQAHPKLIVVIVIDQMRADYIDRFAAYENGGLHFFASQGAYFVNANYDHMPTETCLGHSIVLSGRNPAHTGIVANEWYDRDHRKMTYCVADADSPLLGDSGPGVSPKNFIGENFSDWLQTSYPGARVFSVSLKDRAAITLGGHHAQGVFWFSHDTGNFITSRYYAQRLPAWVDEFNRKHVIDSYAGKQWTPMLDANSPAYHTHEVAGQFPHPMPAKAGRELYEAVYSSPYGDELLEALAETAVTANHLGQNANGAPDLLAVALSSNDAVGHEFGPDSPEIADEQVRIDRTIGKLVEALSSRLGPKNILWVLSADHGAEPTPEAERELNHNESARRIAFSEAQRSIETQLNSLFKVTGAMHWFAGQTDSMLYFDSAELASHNISVSAASEALATQVHDVPGIDAFYDTAHSDSVHGWIGTCLKNSAFPQRSGDVYYLTSEWTLFSSKPTGTSHGYPWPYDTHVPVVLAGWHITPQRIADEVQLVDLAPTLAELTAVHPPPSEVIDGRSRVNLLSAGSDALESKP